MRGIGGVEEGDGGPRMTRKARMGEWLERRKIRKKRTTKNTKDTK